MIGIYARISTEEQSKYSISDQLRQGRKKAGTDNVLEYVDEGVSGEFLDRPALAKLRQDVRDGIITNVICLDPDRLSRKLMNQLIVSEEIEKRAKLEFVNGEYARTPEGMLFYQMRGAVAEFEKAKINERMSRGRREKARQGKVVRDFQVYGYGYDRESGQMVIDEEEAAIIRFIFDLITTPNNLVKGINGIAVYLTQKGVPTKRGASVWHRQVVRQILLNPVYTGVFAQNKWNTEGMLGNKHRKPEDRISMTLRPETDWIEVSCPTIIDKGQFERAQMLIAEGKRRWAKDGFAQYLLSGIIRCGHCGNTMTGRRASHWGSKVFEYTDMKNYSGAKFKGCGMHVQCETTDRYVWNALVDWMNNPASIAAAREEGTESLEDTEQQRLTSDLERTKAGRKRLLNLLTEAEDIGEEEVREKLKELKRKEDDIIKQLQELAKKALNKESTLHSEQAVKEAAAYYIANLEELSFDDKKEIIRHVIREVRVYKDRFDLIQF